MYRNIKIVLLVVLSGLLFGIPTLAAEPIKVGIVGPMNFITGQHFVIDGGEIAGGLASQP